MKKILSGSTIKIIAVITMFADHFGQIVLKNGIALNAPRQLFSDYEFSILLNVIEVCNIIGSIAFPLFCFLLVEGFMHTHNLKKYIIQLGMFAVITEPIYDLSFNQSLFSLNQQNVLFTLLIGVLTLTLIKRCNHHVISAIFLAGLSGFISYFLKLDGWYYGIALITIFYLFHDYRGLKYIFVIVAMYVCGLDYSLHAILGPYFLVSMSSLLIIAFYNGRRGLKMKYVFYLFYPCHLLILYMITVCGIVPLL